MINLEKKYTKSQRRAIKNRESSEQKIKLRKIQNRKNRRFRQKAEDSETLPESKMTSNNHIKNGPDTM
jgi:hypothetical protein